MALINAKAGDPGFFLFSEWLLPLGILRPAAAGIIKNKIIQIAPNLKPLWILDLLHRHIFHVHPPSPFKAFFAILCG